MNRFQFHQLKFLLLAAFLSLTAGTSLAQRQRGQVRIEVRDPAGSAIAANAEIVSEGNGFRRSFQISSDGHTLLQDLPFGIYRLSLEAQGFAEWSKVLEVHSELPVQLAVTLGVAPLTTQVQVNDSVTLVDPIRSGPVVSIGQRTVREQLSLQPGRGLLDLVAAEPGWLYEANGVLHPRGSEYGMQFSVDGQPLMQNRSPGFAPDMDSGDVESMRILTAGFPAEYGRKLSGVVEITTDKSLPAGFHGDLDAAGGSFSHLDGSLGFFYTRQNNTYSFRASGLHSDRYLDPPVTENFSNQGNSGSFSGAYEHAFDADDRLRINISHSTLRYIVPNDLVQELQIIGRERQDANSEETSGQVYFQHSILPTLFLTLSGGVRDSSFNLRSNDLATPVILNQNRGYREGYVRADLAGHHGHHDWKAGVDSFFTPVREFLDYRITDLSQFDPGTRLQFQFSAHKWDIEPAFYIQDQMHYGPWNFSVGLRFDHYSFVSHESAVGPRVGISRFFSSLNLLVHASYDRVFQTPAVENLLLASSPELDSVNPVVLRLPVLPAYGNYYEGGITKSIYGGMRLVATVFRRDFHNYADDDVLLQTGVTFPISFAKARIIGEEVKLEVPHWGRFSGSLGYANQSGVGQGPITGGLLIGSDAQGVLTNTSRFAVSQDQRNTLHVRVRFQVERRVWLAFSANYASGLPAEINNSDRNTLVAEFGENVVSRVNLSRDRVEPSFSMDLGAGAELYHKESRAVQLQLQATNLANRLNVINFASLFSGTAIAPPRSVTARFRIAF